MSENFDRFNAPQFFDFSKDYIEENVESYFGKTYINSLFILKYLYVVLYRSRP